MEPFEALFRMGLRVTATSKDDDKRVEHMNAAHKTLTSIASRAEDMQRKQVQCVSENCRSARDSDNLHRLIGVGVNDAYAGRTELTDLADDGQASSMTGPTVRTLRWWSDNF